MCVKPQSLLNYPVVNAYMSDEFEFFFPLRSNFLRALRLRSVSQWWWCRFYHTGVSSLLKLLPRL